MCSPVRTHARPRGCARASMADGCYSGAMPLNQLFAYPPPPPPPPPPPGLPQTLPPPSPDEPSSDGLQLPLALPSSAVTAVLRNDYVEHVYVFSGGGQNTSPVDFPLTTVAALSLNDTTAAVAACDGDEPLAEPDYTTTAPPQRAHNGRTIKAYHNERDDVGTIAFVLSNTGARPSNAGMREYRDIDLKACPGQILGVLEAQHDTEAVLESEGDIVAVRWRGVAHPRAGSQSHSFHTMRGSEDAAPMVAARASMCTALELVYWVKTDDGMYTGKNKQRKMAHSRILVVKVHLTKGAGVLGDSLVVMLAHFHNQNAAKRLTAAAHEKFWSLLEKATIDHSVDIIMGDFNMSLLCVVPRLRRRGIIVDLCSWFPNTDDEGKCPTHIDSMGIFLIGGTCGVNLRQDLSSLDNMFPNGNGSVSRGRGVHTMAEIVIGARPGLGGFPLDSYMPKQNAFEQLRATLTPSSNELVVRKRASEPFERGRNNRWPAMLEKRLGSLHWDPDGTALSKGAHTPLFVVSRGPGRRSEPRIWARDARRWQDRSRHGDFQQRCGSQGHAVTIILMKNYNN